MTHNRCKRERYLWCTEPDGAEVWICLCGVTLVIEKAAA